MPEVMAAVDSTWVRAAPVKVVVSIAMSAGSIRATPSPWSIDQPSRTNGRLGAKAAISAPRTKTPPPVTKVRRYPWRVPSLLPLITDAATTSAYSEIADCTPTRVVRRSLTSADRATFMAVAV